MTCHKILCDDLEGDTTALISDFGNQGDQLCDSVRQDETCLEELIRELQTLPRHVIL